MISFSERRKKPEESNFELIEKEIEIWKWQRDAFYDRKEEMYDTAG